MRGSNKNDTTRDFYIGNTLPTPNTSPSGEETEREGVPFAIRPGVTQTNIQRIPYAMQGGGLKHRGCRSRLEEGLEGSLVGASGYTEGGVARSNDGLVRAHL